MTSQLDAANPKIEALLTSLGETDRALASLRGLGFLKPEQALDNLRAILGPTDLTAEGPRHAALLGRWLAESFDPARSLNNLERLFQRATTRRELLERLCARPRLASALAALFSGSQHLADALLRDETLLTELDEPSFLEAGADRQDWQQVLAAQLREARTDADQFASVRRFKTLREARIVLRDLTKAAPTEETLRELSWTADLCIQQVLEICLAGFIHRYGRPYYRDSKGQRHPADFTILGLGKLGGEELNFSSDVDLIYLYSSDEGETEGVRQPRGGATGVISLHEFFTRLAKAVTAALSDHTGERALFRVDLRLRPEGKSGDIACSLRSYEIYYESWGETWERLALVKARVVAGSQALGEAFLQMIRPFVYRKYLDYGALEEIRGIKERINRSRRSARHGEDHVKFGPGGIREVEFVVQALQLVLAGKNPSLQERNTLRALDRLHQAGHLSAQDYGQLRNAYLFLRDLENRIQMLHGLQQSSLPPEPADREALARKMGHRDGEPAVNALLEEYRRHTGAVARIYGSLFRDEAGEARDETWQVDLEYPEAAARSLASMGFEDPQRTYDNLILLRDGPLFVHPTAKSKRLFYGILPHLLRSSISLPYPDQAVNNLERFLTQSRAREMLLSILVGEEKFNELLLTLFGSSQFLSNILLSNPILIDSLMNPAALLQRRSPPEMEVSLREQLSARQSRLPANAMRAWKQAEELRIGLLFLLAETSLAETVEDLTHLADICLREALAQADEGMRRDAVAAWGHKADGCPATPRTALMGLGKLGGQEMNFGSDLDLLLLYTTDREMVGGGAHREAAVGAAGKPALPAHEYATHLYAKLLELISGFTEAGQLYKIDMRIRPQGEKGPLAVSLLALVRYLDEQMETWERQALTRLRWIAGDPELGRRAIEEVHRSVYRPSDPSALAAEIHYMRHRMETELAQEREGCRNVKVGYGGLVDVEFIVQYLQLYHGQRVPSLRQPNTLRALAALREADLLDPETSEHLAEHYLFLREVEARLRIVTDRQEQFPATDQRELARLARSMGYRTTAFTREAESLLSAYETHTERVRSIYRRTFGRSG